MVPKNEGEREMAPAAEVSPEKRIRAFMAIVRAFFFSKWASGIDEALRTAEKEKGWEWKPDHDK